MKRRLREAKEEQCLLAALQPIWQAERDINEILRPPQNLTRDAVVEGRDYKMLASAPINAACFAGFVVMEYVNYDWSINPEAQTGEHASGQLLGVLKGCIVIDHTWNPHCALARTSIDKKAVIDLTEALQISLLDFKGNSEPKAEKK